MGTVSLCMDEKHIDILVISWATLNDEYCLSKVLGVDSDHNIGKKGVKVQQWGNG